MALSNPSITLVMCVLLVTSLPCTSSYQLKILHTNDVHAHIQQSNARGSSCSAEQEAASLCYGGVARLKTEIDRQRSQSENTLLLDAGDQFQGTIWFNYYGGKEAAHFMSQLGYEAMAVGNHELDRGAEGLGDFLDDLAGAFPVISANLELNNEPALQGKLQRSVVLTVGGEDIGIVGYTTKETSLLVHPDKIGKVTFTDEIEALRVEVTKLNASGVNKIIALGHAGIKMDLMIGRQVEGVDVVVGGHSNTFFYTGAAPDSEDVEGDYPTVVESPSGKSVPVVQAYTHGKYLGNLDVTFNTEGDITNWGGNPILLNGSVPRDAAILEDVVEWSLPLVNLSQQLVGESYVLLEGSRDHCRVMECNMGNFVTDAILSYHLRPPASPDVWSHVAMAIWNSGGIRTTFPAGDISRANVLEVLPFSGQVMLVRMQGRYLLGLLERSVEDYHAVDPHGKFLQFSGLRVVYNLYKPNNHRVHSVQVLCTDCPFPEYIDLQEDVVYTFLTLDFLAKGGDGYNMTAAEEMVYLGSLDIDCLEAYIVRRSPVVQGLEGRIQFISESEMTTQGPENNTMTGLAGETTEPTTTPRRQLTCEGHNLNPSHVIIFTILCILCGSRFV